jgi:formyl-CoA transferase/CoA:oxalate CoA-transferase
MTEDTSPLTRTRVIDMTQALAGPYAAMLLGDLGADVIKVEPLHGDQSRGYRPPEIGSESAYFLSFNRNKRSLTLNYTKPEGQEILRRLLLDADVFLTNNPRVESMRKYSYDFETLRAANPGLIMAAISGYGHTGPRAGLPGYDVIAQGEAGTMSMTGEPDGGPIRFPSPMADISGGIYAAIGVLAALVERARSGRGQLIDTSLLESQATWLANLAGGYFATNEPPERLGNAHPQLTPYQPYRARDNYFNLGVGSERLWGRFCAVMGLEHLQEDERFETNKLRTINRDALNEILEPLFLERDADEWVTLFQKEGLPCGPINSVADLLNDEHFLARGGVVELEHSTLGAVKSLGSPIRLSRSPVEYRLPPPTLGQHTDMILAELGYNPDEITALRADEVV